MSPPVAPAAPALAPAARPVAGPDAALIFQQDATGNKPKRAKREAKAKREELIGLSIGAATLRAALVRDGLLVRVAEYPLPRGVIERGVLVNPSGLSAAIKDFWAQAGFRTREVNFSITNRQVTLRTLELPITENDDELQLAVKHMAPTVLEPLDPKKAVIDFAQLSRAGRRQQIQIAAADKEMISAFINAVQKGGLRPISCEIGPLAESRAIVVPRDPDFAQGVVNIGAEVTSFCAASGPDVFFMRTLAIGGNDFTRAVAETMQCDFDEAEQLKRRAGLGAQPVDPTLDPDTFAQIQGALLTVSDQLAQSLADSRRFYQQTSDGRRVTGMLILGGGSRLFGLADLLSMELGVDEMTEPRAREGLDGLRDPSRYAGALGLALGHRMSLMVEQKVAAIGVSVTGKRKLPKISQAGAKDQVKRLRARKQTGSTTNPALVGLLIGVALGSGAFFYGNKLKAENDSLRLAVETDKQVQTAPTLAYTSKAGDVTKANQVAGALGQFPSVDRLALVDQHIQRLKISKAQVKFANDMVTLSGSAPDSAVEQLEGALRKQPGLVDIKRVAAKASGPFTITFRAPALTTGETQ